MTNGQMARQEIDRLTGGGMTVSEIARRVEKDALTITQIVNGENENPPDTLLAALRQIATPVQPERRAMQSGSITIDDKAISGLASVYYDGTPKTEFSLTSTVIERIHAGAFDSILSSGADMFALYNHEESQLLGRRSSGTLKLEDTPKGLSYSIPYDATDPIHQTVASRIRRGDVTGSSLTFYIAKSDGQKFERRSDGKVIRNITKFDRVVDVGPTHLNAYAGTTAEFRSSSASAFDIGRVEKMISESLAPIIEPPTPIELFYAQRGI